MTRAPWVALLAAAAACAPASPTPPSAPPDGGRADAGSSPPGAHATVRVSYPAAGHALTLRGGGAPLDWDHGLAGTHTSADSWTFDLGELSAPVEFKPLLDDTTWSRGANYLVHPGEALEVAPHFFEAAGTVTLRWPAFHSAALGNDRPVWVYLPAGYAENPHLRCPVLYLQDGQNLFDASLAFGGTEWEVDETLDSGGEALARDAAIRPLIVVAPGNTQDRMNEYTLTYDASEGFGGRGAQYLQFLADELKPQVDAAFRTLPGRADTGVGGSSLGGILSVAAGVERAETFGRVAALSPSSWWDGRAPVAEAASLSGRPLRPLAVYLDSGDSGPSADSVQDTAELAAAFRGAGYRDGVDLLYVLQPGATHTESAWASRLPGALRFLFPPP